VPVRATIAGLLLCALSHAPAAAQDVTLRVDMPGECGTPEAFRARVRALLGARSAALEPGIAVQMSQRDEGGYRLRVVLPEGVRELDEPDCSDLPDAAALIVASSLKEAATPRAERESRLAKALDEPAPQPSRAARVLAVPESAVEPAPVVAAKPRRPDRGTTGESRRARPPRAVRLATGAGLVWGLLPGVSPALEVQAGARLGRAEPALTLRYFAPRDEKLEEGSVRVQALSGSLGAGYLALPWLRVGLAADMHALRARARRLDGAGEDWAFTFGPRLESWATLLERDGGQLAVGAAGLYQVRAARFTSAQGEVLHAASSWGFQAGMRGAWEFF
jgi:hypothetical protein